MEHESACALHIVRYNIADMHICVQTGECIRTLEDGKDGQNRGHMETVTAICWVPDGSGFVSGALDKKIILWVCSLTLHIRQFHLAHC